MAGGSATQLIGHCRTIKTDHWKSMTKAFMQNIGIKKFINHLQNNTVRDYGIKTIERITTGIAIMTITLYRE